MGKWFNAKDAVPTSEIFYLVVIDECVQIAVWHPWEGKWSFNGEYLTHIEDVTHFRRLPKAPSGN